MILRLPRPGVGQREALLAQVIKSSQFSQPVFLCSPNKLIHVLFYLYIMGNNFKALSRQLSLRFKIYIVKKRSDTSLQHTTDFMLESQCTSV